jgi:aminoglycoside phosphotransferase (APT) family kinase protein
VPVNGLLPDAGPGRYRELLQGTCAFISQHLANPVLTPVDVDMLEALHAHLGDVAAHWDRMDAICAGLPRTLVHGDFNSKNLLMRSDNGHRSVLVFDWEEAGWGIPAADLAQQSLLSNRLSANPDLSTYWSIVRDRWPDTSVETVQRLAVCGSAFRALAGMSWEVLNLADDWAHTSMSALQTYVIELDDALERLGWSKQ